MIDITKQYKTRDGREVRIYATDGLNGHRVHGAIRHPEYGWEHRAWFKDGRMHGTNQMSDSDLIEVKPRIKREVWVNVYPAFLDSDMVHSTKRMADQEAAPDRIACVRLTIDVEEGEGL